MRDSANDAFFTAESLENLSEALVREGIQNSLDAANRQNGVRQVVVKISLKPEGSSAAKEFLKTQFASAANNFEKGLGNIDINLMFKEGCGYLTFEDFGTKGLAGDVKEWRLEYAEENAFFSFFRAEGRSAKSGEKLGRWGIGKQVFPTASRLHAMFGLTVRADSPTHALMGSAVVRTHSIGSKDFQPDGWFGCRERPEEPVNPVSELEFIKNFEKTFELQRGNKPGLSIVVPCVDERVNLTDLRRGVVRSFFWPILAGDLIVDLEGSGGSFRIDAETLQANRELLPASEAAVIEFANWASTAKPEERVALSSETATRPIWKDFGEQLLSETKLSEIRSKLETQQRVEIRVPVRVRPKAVGAAERMSYFTVFLGACRDVGHRPIFLRDGIVITDIRSPQMSGNRSLVVIDDPPLAGLLGDSEGVNHTQWQKDSPKFHNRFFYGPDTIKFVTRSVYEIMQRVHAAETKGDPTLLLDIFYLPEDEGPVEPSSKRKGEKPQPTIPPGPPPIPVAPKKYELEQVKGGFRVKAGKAQIEAFPYNLRIEAGYAVRRGNPIKRWGPDDFAFIRSPIKQDAANGVIVSRADGNTLELEVRKADFQFAVSGFDPRRDLVVRATELKSENE